MPRKMRQLRADLRKAGCFIIHQKGSHEQWTHPIDTSFRKTLSGHDGSDALPNVRDLLAHIEACRKGQR